MRCKMRVTAISDYGNTKKLVFSAVTNDGQPENASFWKATPSGSIELQVDNLRAVAEFKPGQLYYVDFTPVDLTPA